MEDVDVVVVHILRDGKKLAYVFTKLVFSFVFTEGLTYTSMHDIPEEAKGIINMDKSQI